MTPGDKKDNLPAPIRIDNLRSHFHHAYGLSEEQVEVMVNRSAQSLAATLGQLNNTLAEDDNLPELTRLAHNLKGVLLNLGESEWAEFARRLEKSAAKGGVENHREIVANIRWGAEMVLGLADE